MLASFLYFASSCKVDSQCILCRMTEACIGEGNGNPLQYSCLENPRDGGASGLLSMGSHRVRHDWSDLAAAAAEAGMRWMEVGGSDSERFDSANKPPWKGGEETFWSFSYCSLGLSKRLFKMHIQFSSVTQLCPTLCNPVNHSLPGLPVHQQLPESTQTHVHWVDDAIKPSHPLSPLLLLPSIFPSIRVFSNESALCTRWPKYWRFSFSIIPSNEHPGLISYRMD